MILTGEVALWLALLMAAWSASLSIAGRRLRREELLASGARAAYAVPLLLLVAAAGLWYALLEHDFTLRQVAEHSARELPWPNRLSALWAGVGGSLLLWSVALSVHGALLARALRRRGNTLAPIATAVISVLTLALLGVLSFAAYPYERIPWAPANGMGLIPELQHPAMAVHPPLLHFGYAAAAAPFALVIAALLAHEADARWIGLARRWAAASWALLTAAILLGMRWALVTPGWEGLWQWEPVQVMALVAWIVSLVLLHGGILERRWRGGRPLAVWLAGLWFPLALLGLAAAHAGESGGRHAFRNSPAEAPLVALVLLAHAVAIGLLLMRGRELTRDGAPGVRGGGALRPPALVAHVGAAILVAALAAQAATRTYRVTLEPARTVELTDPVGGVWELTSQGESRDRAARWEVTSVGLEVTHDGRALGLLAPEVREIPSPDPDRPGRSWSEVAIRSTMFSDMSVMLAGMPDQSATLLVAFHPFARWIWIGGALAVIGALTGVVGRRFE